MMTYRCSSIVKKIYDVIKAGQDPSTTTVYECTLTNGTSIAVPVCQLQGENGPVGRSNIAELIEDGETIISLKQELFVEEAGDDFELYTTESES